MQTHKCLDCKANVPINALYCPGCGRRMGDERKKSDRREGADRRQAQKPIAGLDRRKKADRRTKQDRRKFSF